MALSHASKKLGIFFVVLALVVVGYGISPALGGIGSESVQVTANQLSGTTTAQTASPAMVWTSATEGFYFYMPPGLRLAMSTTSDGGATWSAPVDVDSVNTTDGVMFAVWYDRWTEGDTGDFIHVVTTDTSVDDTYYTRVNAQKGTTSATVLGTTQGATCTAGSSCYTSITKARNGTLYMTATDGSDSWVVSCSTTCTTAGNWSERVQAYGSTPDLGDDIPLLFPVVGTDNVMLIYWDNSALTVDWNTYSATSSMWMGSTTRTAITGLETEVTYEGMKIAGTYSTTTGDIYISVVDDANDFTTQDHDVDVWKFSTTTYTWTQLTDATTTTKGGIIGQKIHRDGRTGNLNVIYGWRSTIGTPQTANLYMVQSTDGGTSWTASSTSMAEQDGSITRIVNDPFSFSYFGVGYNYVFGTYEDDIFYNRILTLWESAVGAVGGAITRQSEIWFD